MEWYFDHPHHHYHYSHLSASFVNHYYGHRHSGTTISMGVGAWRDHNREIMTDDWLKDQGRLPERLREYGRFEEKRQEFNARNPGRQLGPNEFLAKNARQYPELTREQEQATKQSRTTPAEMERQPSDWAPKKEPVHTEPARKPEPARQPAPAQPAPRKPAAEPQDAPRQPVKKDRPLDNAEDFHRQKWDEKNRQTTPQPSAPAKPQPQKTDSKQRKTDRKKD